MYKPGKYALEKKTLLKSNESDDGVLLWMLVAMLVAMLVKVVVVVVGT